MDGPIPVRSMGIGFIFLIWKGINMNYPIRYLSVECMQKCMNAGSSRGRYTLLDTVHFCLDMNEELLREPPSLTVEKYEEYVSDLRGDERILTSLLEKYEKGCENI